MKYRRNPNLIDREVGLEIRDAIVSNRAKIFRHLPEKIGQVGSLLGAGHYGMVYETADPCWVFKATTDPWEAAFALVQRGGAISLDPGVGVVFYGFVQYVKRLPGCRRPLFVVVRSAVRDLGFITSTDSWQADALWTFKSHTEAVGMVIESLSSPRKRSDFKKRLLEYEWMLEQDMDPYDEQHRDLQAIAYSDEMDASSDSEESHLRSLHMRGDPEPELTLATAAKLVLAKTIASENRGLRGPEADVWKVLHEYADGNVLLADVHFGNIGRYAPGCVPEEACSPDGWIISDPGHGVILDDGFASDVAEAFCPTPFSVLVPW